MVLLALVCFSCACVTVAAQQSRPRRPAPANADRQPAPNRQPEPKTAPLASDPDVQAADIAIIADIKAESLVFEVVPNPKVEFPGSHKLITVWVAFRDNLPTPVQPGVTYRNIGIRLKITSAFADIDRIVSEALGEVPVSQEVKPADQQSPRTSNPQSPPSQTSPPPPPRER